MEVLFVVLFAYLRKMRSEKLQKAAEAAASKAQATLPLDQVKQALPAMMK